MEKAEVNFDGREGEGNRGRKRQLWLAGAAWRKLEAS